LWRKHFNLSHRCFSKLEKWNDNQKPKKNLRKGIGERTSGLAKCDRLILVLVRLSTWDRWDCDRGVSIMGGTGWDFDRGVFRLGGTGWDWDRWVFRLGGAGWDWDRGVFQRNQSTCPNVTTREGMGAEEKRKKTKIIPGTQPKARAGWPKRLRLVQATP